MGHIKIPNETDKYEYKNNSNISLFSKKLHLEFKQRFSEKYIRHFSFTYMMYFYTFSLDDNGHLTKFEISDSFLPLKLEKESSDYIFSLIFPMGLVLSPDKSNIFISAGYGDYEAALMRFKTDEVLSLCKHDIQNLDLNNYEYKIIASDKDKVKIARYLHEI